MRDVTERRDPAYHVSRYHRRMMSDEEAFYSPNKKPAPPREPRPGEEVWQVTSAPVLRLHRHSV
jgi:hypothetical protein